MTNFTDADLAAMKARADAATLGPWDVEQDVDVTNRFPRYRLEAADGLLVVGEVRHEFECGGRDDAEFIAHAREDVPALLAEVAALRKQIDVADKAPHEEGCQWPYPDGDPEAYGNYCNCWRAEYDAAKDSL